MTYFMAKEENRHNGKAGNQAVNSKFITMEEELKDAITVLGNHDAATTGRMSFAYYYDAIKESCMQPAKDVSGLV